MSWSDTRQLLMVVVGLNALGAKLICSLNAARGTDLLRDRTTPAEVPGETHSSCFNCLYPPGNLRSTEVVRGSMSNGTCSLDTLSSEFLPLQRKTRLSVF
jgi:hypothetical protein